MLQVKISKMRIFLFLLIIGLCFSMEDHIEYFSKEKIIEYADYLFENDEYQMAINEYQRAYYISDNNREKLNLKMNIGKCYNYLGRYDSSIDIYKSVINESSDNAVLAELRYQIGLIYFEKENYSLSEKYLIENTTQIHKTELLEKNLLLISAIYILQNKSEEASSLLNNVPLINSNKSLRLNKIINKLNLNKKKNPHLAGILSALIPGSGKIYSNNIGDAIYSFLSIIGTGYIAYSEMQNGTTDSVKFLAFGILSCTFYLGNIYGSYLASHLYNEKMQDELLIKIKECIEI